MDGSRSYLDGKVIVRAGDCLDVIRTLADCSIDSVVTDPPYALVSVQKRLGNPGSAPVKSNGATGVYARGAAGFMGKQWDTGDVAFSVEFWAEALRVLKPGGHLLAFGGTRTYHRLACAIEDAGFEIRDQIGWAYGSGFPKSLDVSKAIPAARQWAGWGTALKPAWEPICVARKPLSEGTVAANVLRWGTGAINVDGCRVGTTVETWPASRSYAPGQIQPGGKGETQATGGVPPGRWPANLIHDGSDEVVAAFPDAPGQQRSTGPEFQRKAHVYGKFAGVTPAEPRGDSGSSARFFYQVKQDKLPLFEEIVVSWTSESGQCQAKLQVDTAQSPPRVIVASPSTDASEWNTFLFGNGLADLCRTAISFTTSTAISSTTDSIIWNWLTRLHTSGCIADVKCETGNGGSHVESAGRSIRQLTIILDQTVSFPGASRALSKTPLRISVNVAPPERQRLWYSSKADSDDRLGSAHPTIKPVDLMQYLVRLVTPRGGTVLDPFAGTGTTGEAAFREGCMAVLIEREPEYLADIERRMGLVLSGAVERRHATIKAKGKIEEPGGLFA